MEFSGTMSLPRIYLAGNPNSGKSTLFNALTGLHHKTANFPGVTVESLQAEIELRTVGKSVLVDLPGTYSLYPQSQDEWVACQVLVQAASEGLPTLVVVVVDAANLNRSMLLISQIQELGLKMQVVLNKCDRVASPGMKGVVQWFENEMNIKALVCDARKGLGLKEVSKAFDQRLSEAGHPTASNEPSNGAASNEPGNWAASWNQVFGQGLEAQNTASAAVRARHSAETIDRYRRINQSLKTCPLHETKAKAALPNGPDLVLLHPVGGILVFVAVMALMFQALFAWASYPMDFIENIMLWAGENLRQILEPRSTALSHLVTKGLMPGIGGVLVFVPQIFLLFLFLVLLEESGYMARVSYLMDRNLKKIGLNGKSIVPMLGGFACAVPAIAATRNIVSWKERLSTIMILPLMSCSARLPVYALLIQFAVPEGYILGIFSLQGLTMMGLYLMGVVAAVLSALVMKFWIREKGPSYFMLEIPAYQWPVSRNLWQVPLRYCLNFVQGAGKVIVIVSLLLWVLASFGPGYKISETLTGKAPPPALEKSYAGVLGKALEPAIRPLGFDWKIGIALVTSFAAREVFVGTMATIYGLEGDPNEDGNQLQLKERMQKDTVEGSKEPLFNRATVWSLLVFYAFALQCMSTVAATRQETRSWKWPLIQLFYLSALAYLASLAVYQWSL
ncbi:MAG: ferrous iron transport protein B [Bacteroidia bacterium]